MRPIRRPRLFGALALALMLPALAGTTAPAVAAEPTGDAVVEPAESVETAGTIEPVESDGPVELVESIDPVTDPVAEPGSETQRPAGEPGEDQTDSAEIYLPRAPGVIRGSDPADQPPPGADDGIPIGGATPSAGQPTGESVAAVEPAAVATQRYFGSGPWAAIKNAADAQTRCTGLSAKELRALVLSTIFLESAGATSPGSIPSPMTLSRYDEWTGVRAGNTNQNANYGLYAFRDPYTGYKRAFWHPGIGIWQYDSAGLGAPYTAAERINTDFLAPKVAAGMASRYCSSGAGSEVGKRYDAWLPWSASCDSGSGSPNATLCEEIYQGLIQQNFGNVTVLPGYSATGGAVKHSCLLGNSTTAHTCWRIDPAQAQGATWWATRQPLDGGAPNRKTSPLTPIAAPFYVLERDGREVRYWLAEDTGYSLDISGTRTLGKNARPKDNQAGSGVDWGRGSGLCDVTLGAGDCGVPVPPRGVNNTELSVRGAYQPVVIDVNGDGIDDVFWYAAGAASDSFWLTTGPGTFRSVATQVTGEYQVLAAEMTGNAAQELVLYSAETGALHLWRGKGDGTFVKVTMDLEPGLWPMLLDEDGDGISELFLHGPGELPDHRIRWDGKRFADEVISVRGFYRPIVGDFDGNGHDDIFWYAPGNDADSIWLTRRAGGRVHIPVTVSGTDHSPVVGDLDGDGRDDIVFKSPSTEGGSIWFGGVMASFTKISTGGAAGIVPVVADLDGNGRDDLVYVGPGAIKDHLLRFAKNRSRTSAELTLTGTQQVLAGTWTKGREGLFWYGEGARTDWLWWR